MNIINLTPHAITFVDNNGNIICEVPASGIIARVLANTVVTGMFDGIPITETVYGDVENLPNPVDETIYIVSSLVAQRCKERNDVYIPNESVRDDSGKIIGCKSLGKI